MEEGGAGGMSVEGPYELPKGWEWAKIEDCVDVLDSKRVPINSKERQKRIEGKLTSELCPYYGATGQVGWIDNYLFDEELVLLGEDGAPFFDVTKNKAYIVNYKSWVNNHAHVLRAIVEVTTNGFLCNYLNIFDYSGYVSGTTRHKLNQKSMRNIPFPLPPLPEQRRIVARIEELFTQLDAGISALETSQAQLKRYRQSVLKAAVEGKLTEKWRAEHPDVDPASALLERIEKEREKNVKGRRKKLPPLDVSELPELPEGWEWTNLSQLKEFSLYGPRFSSNDYDENGYIVLRTSDISDSGKVNANTAPKLPLSVDQFSKYKVKLGDLLITRTGSLGTLAVFNDAVDAIPGAYLIQYRIVKLIKKTWYLFYFLKSPSGQNQLTCGGAGVGRPNLNAPTIEAIPVPFPPLAEQHEIVSEIERRLSVADQAEVTIAANLKHVARLRQSILKKAFRGELVPQDTNDEPASILLERIRAERAKSPPKKRRGRPRKNSGQKELI